MKLTFIISLLSVIVVSCDNFIFNVERVTKDFRVYYQNFVEEGKGRRKEMIHSDIVVKFKDIDTAAKTRHTAIGVHKVFVDPDQWKKLNDVERELLIFHELGHALLDRRHLASGGCIRSIMQDQPIDAEFFLLNRTALLDELFGVSQPTCIE